MVNLRHEDSRWNFKDSLSVLLVKDKRARELIDICYKPLRFVHYWRRNDFSIGYTSYTAYNG